MLPDHLAQDCAPLCGSSRALTGKNYGSGFERKFIGYQPHCLHIRCCCCMGIAASFNIFVCPQRRGYGAKRNLLNTWRRVAFKIILRKRAGQIFGQTGNWLKSTKGSQTPNRADIARCWSKLGGLLNNYPRKVAGVPTAAEIRQSVLRCARNVTGISSSFRGNSQLNSEHS